MELLQPLLLVYAAILLISACFSAFCLFYYKDKLYRFALLLWLSTFINALAEGLLQKTHLAMVLGFATYFVCSLILVQILSEVTHHAFPLKKYGVLMAACLLVSIGAAEAGAGFVLIALPAAIGIVFPMFHSALKTLFSLKIDSQRRGIQMYCGLLLANGLHFLDYPFLRLKPDFAVLGFTIALGLLMALAIFLPSLIIKNISDRYTDNVSSLNLKLVEYQNQMADLLSLAQVGELSFGFVHDMASPTMLLAHYSEQISEMHRNGVPTGDKLLPFSKGIEKATSRLLKLQKMFRAMISKDADAAPADVDLKEVLQSCVDLFKPFLEKKGIQMKVSFTGENKSMTLRQGVIERVLLNLIHNASNALMTCETREIQLSLNSTEEEHTFEVRDTGPGLPPERLENLWQRFGHSETGKKSVGSGFGLYKVKTLCDSIGAKIRVESSSQGTVFKITLPTKTDAITQQQLGA